MSPVALRRLKDRIDALCKLAIEVPESQGLAEILQELRTAIHQHTQSLRKLAVSIPQPGRRATDFSLPSARPEEGFGSADPERK